MSSMISAIFCSMTALLSPSSLICVPYFSTKAAFVLPSVLLQASFRLHASTFSASFWFSVSKVLHFNTASEIWFYKSFTSSLTLDRIMLFSWNFGTSNSESLQSRSSTDTMFVVEGFSGHGAKLNGPRFIHDCIG